MRGSFLLLLALASCSLPAQVIDRQNTRFLSAPHARPGTWAPLRVVFEGRGECTVECESRGVRVTRRAAAGSNGRGEALLSCPVEDGVTVRLRAGDVVDEFQPELPPVAVPGSYVRQYAAVVSPDPVEVRAILGLRDASLVCDYYEDRGFYDDWRFLDGYDAVILFNPGAGRLPHGSQRALAEFLSLGGALFVAGSFSLGESVEGLPPPADPEPMVFEQVPVLRFGYGAGSIYRAAWDDLRRSGNARRVILAALEDHRWFGRSSPPAGEPPTRGAWARDPAAYLPPAPPEMPQPGFGFWALAGALLLALGLAPALALRLTRRPFLPTFGAACLAAVAVGLVGANRQAPPPGREAFLVEYCGGAASGAIARREILWEEAPGSPEDVPLIVDLDDLEDRGLPRRLAAPPGWRGWLVDRPLTPALRLDGEGWSLVAGEVNGAYWRDFAAWAARTESGIEPDHARLLEWWLESNVYRGRRADLKSGGIFVEESGLSRFRIRGVISITEIRGP